MTEELKNLMERRAAEMAPAHFDVATILRDGERAIHRRRAGLVAASAGLVLAAGLTVPQLLAGGVGPADTDTSVAHGLAVEPPAYAVGRTLHLGDQTLELPTGPRAMVQTPTGVVYVDDTGKVQVTRDGLVVGVGQTNPRNPVLVVDEDRVAWVDTSQDVPHFTVLDHSRTSVVASPLANDSSMGTLRDSRNPAVVFALDGDLLYVRDPRGAVAWNFVTDAQTVLLADANGFAIDDVQNGQIAYSAHGPNPDGVSYRVGPDLQSGHALDVWSGAALSPDATYLLGEDDPEMAAVFDVATGRTIGAAPKDYDFVGGFTWIDDDTYLALGLTKPWDRTPVDVLRCDVGGACDAVAAQLPSFEDGLVLPVGEALG